MASATWLLCLALAVISSLGSAQDDAKLPSYKVCKSEDMWSAMEQTCAYPTWKISGGHLYLNVDSLEEFGKKCCSTPCSIRYFTHLCDYPESERRAMAFHGEILGKRRKKRSLKTRSLKKKYKKQS